MTKGRFFEYLLLLGLVYMIAHTVAPQTIQLGRELATLGPALK